MHRTTRPVLLTAAIAVALSVSACATTVTGTPAAPAAAPAAPATSATSQGDAVTWVDGVCGALLPFAEAAATEPKIDTANPTAAVQGLSSYLGDAVTSLDTALDGLGSAGPSPVEGGDEVVASLTTALTRFRTSFQDSKTQIDAVDPSDVSQLASALPEALAPLQELQSLPDPAADLKKSPELDRAAQQAPNCRALPGFGG